MQLCDFLLGESQFGKGSGKRGARGTVIFFVGFPLMQEKDGDCTYQKSTE